MQILAQLLHLIITLSPWCRICSSTELVNFAALVLFGVVCQDQPVSAHVSPNVIKHRIHYISRFGGSWDQFDLGLSKEEFCKLVWLNFQAMPNLPMF